MTAASIRRPVGATFLAFLLGWLGIAGVMNSFVWWTLPSEFVAQTSPTLQSALLAIRTPTMSTIALAYGLSALASCVGIWRMRPWMRHAMSCWVTSVGAFCVYMLIAMPPKPVTLLAELAFILPLGFLVAALWLYVARLSERAAL